jgi:hypothetical protein
MPGWLRPVLERLIVGLVPVDGDFGRREAASNENNACPEVEAVERALSRETEDPSWIPRAVLYGPPL